jgi:hypothetical protein
MKLIPLRQGVNGIHGNSEYACVAGDGFAFPAEQRRVSAQPKVSGQFLSSTKRNRKNRPTHEPNRRRFFAYLNKGSVGTAVTLFAPERPVGFGGRK